jgi:hypothetical protein
MYPLDTAHPILSAQPLARNQFGYSPLPWLFIAGMICTVVLQTHLLNLAMMKGDVMSVFPVFQVQYEDAV